MEVSDLRMCLLRLFLLLVTFVISPVSGVLVSGPRDILSKEGATLNLSCSTNLDQPVRWARLRYGQRDNLESIYQDKGDITDNFAARFSVSANQPEGFYNLTIENVERNDAGIYTCFDNKGHDPEQHWAANLTILANNVIGVQNISSDSEIKCENDRCDPERLTLNCTIAFTGDIHLAPVISWRKITSSGVDEDLTHVALIVTNTNSSVSSSVTLPVKAADLDGVKFRCEVKDPDGSVIISWTSTSLVFASTKSFLVIAIVVSVVIFVIILIIILLVCWKRNRKSLSRPNDNGEAALHLRPYTDAQYEDIPDFHDASSPRTTSYFDDVPAVPSRNNTNVEFIEKPITPPPKPYRTFRWTQPLPLLENVSGASRGGKSRMLLVEATVAKLRCIQEPVVVVAVVGLYRTGKSFLVNRLLGNQQMIKESGLEGFDVGCTVQKQTKGIWVMCVEHPKSPGYKLLLMDTEGLGDVEKGDEENDVTLFTLATLLSSTLIYNCTNVINQGAIDDIHFVSEIANRFKIKSKLVEDKGASGGTDPSFVFVEKEEDYDTEEYMFGTLFPRLVWVGRDFDLELTINEKSVTADAYLEHSLKPKRGYTTEIVKYNTPRQCIRRYFASRKCFMLPRPVISEDPSVVLAQLSTLPDKALSPPFVRGFDELRQYVLAYSKPKEIGGVVLNGESFAGIVEQYVTEISAGRIPCIQNAVLTTADAVNRAALDEAVARYREKMSEGGTEPVDKLTLSFRHSECIGEIMATYHKQIMVVKIKPNLGKTLMDALESELKSICEDNEKKLAKHYRNQLDRFLQELQGKLDRNAYFHRGGYAEYNSDFMDACTKFNALPGSSCVQAISVMSETSARLADVANNILRTDEVLTEAEKTAAALGIQKKVIDLDSRVISEREQLQALEEKQKEMQLKFEAAVEEKLAAQARERAKHLEDLIHKMEEDIKQLRKDKLKEEADELEENLKQLKAQQQMSTADVWQP